MKAKETEKLVNVIAEFLWEQNDSHTRNDLGKQISKLYGYEFKDSTTPEMVNNNFVAFDGFNPKTKKVLRITVSPNSAITENIKL